MDTGNAEMSGGKTSICLKDSICPDPPEEEWVTRECLVPLREKRKPTEKRGAPSKWLMKDTREEKKWKMLESFDLPEQLVCPLCLEAFMDPMLLDCGHNMCHLCLLSLSQQLSASCPLCLKSLSGQKCKANHALGSLAQQIKEAGSAQSADQHLNSCKTGQWLREQASCVAQLNVSVEKDSDDLEDDLVELQTQFKHLKGQCKLQEQSMSKLSEMASRLDQHLESEFSILQRFLQERKEKLQRELHKDVTEAKRLMDEELKKMREKCQSMEEAVGRITGDNGSSASGKGIQFLTNRCGEGQNTDFPKWSLDKIESRLLGQFRGPVQFAAWRDMRDVLEPGLSCPRLDPGVAHPDLLLSEGHCRISYFPRSWESTLNTPRFTQYLVALGTPKYKSGKHYWELEIGMDTECDIGVSLDTISRNDPFALHPDDGCWVCSIRGDQHIVAFDSSPRIFLQQKKPKRIGIYLGYEEGQISFYNAQTMGHIYTFRATFQGDLRAYISPCSVTDGERCEQLLRVFQQNL
ncbi:hypothetical protein GDO86_018840 [Hymenochirus boettgeri]|uniref:Uncharacterized protein n=1 Tax=Hymenochirus boettgeri TaxID=247094 RepID=A0A8T2IKD6_9PIPI|nr:hypothetical protein GDO86_018840 [Hymenochirus boettgeri]